MKPKKADTKQAQNHAPEKGDSKPVQNSALHGRRKVSDFGGANSMKGFYSFHEDEIA